jgi:hypothetical protein
MLADANEIPEIQESGKKEPAGETPGGPPGKPGAATRRPRVNRLRRKKNRNGSADIGTRPPKGVLDPSLSSTAS